MQLAQVCSVSYELLVKFSGSAVMVYSISMFLANFFAKSLLLFANCLSLQGERYKRYRERLLILHLCVQNVLFIPLQLCVPVTRSSAPIEDLIED